MGRLSENSVVNVKNKSHAVSGQIVVPASGASGTIIAQGGRFDGWTVDLTSDVRPAYGYNLFGLELVKVAGEDPVAPGEHQVRVEFDYDGGGVGKGGTATLYLDGDEVASGRVDNTVPGLFSADETTDVAGMIDGRYGVVATRIVPAMYALKRLVTRSDRPGRVGIEITPVTGP